MTSASRPKNDDPERAARNQAKKERRQAKQAEAEKAAAASTTPEPVDRAKALKALNKKLRQIQQLKEDMAQDAAMVLNDEQKEKLSREPDLLRQIQALSMGS